MNKVLFSSNSDEWNTPDELYRVLNDEFHFDLDPCSTELNHKCNLYYTMNDDGLSKDWSGHIVFCNPPYSDIKRWVKKCFIEGSKPGTTVVMLIPARTDTSYFHDYIYHNAEIRFIRGRLKFNNSKSSAPFPSMIVIFRGL